jgi:mRNA interferase MazF
MVTKYIPKRGEVVWISFSPQKGHEQSGVRPALVMTDISFNQRTGLIFVVPISSKSHNYNTEIKYKGRHISGSINGGQIKTMDWKERKVSYIETVDRHTLIQVQNIVVSLIANSYI